MSLIDADIIPPNDLRLPDALTIKHGPAPLLARFVLEGDKACRDIKLRLRLRHDFGELAYANRHYATAGQWYPLVDMYNPDRTALGPENAFWVSGETEDRDIVVTWAARIFDWTGTNLADAAQAMWYGEGSDQPCVVTAEAASQISGIVVCGGASWVRPDFRGQHLSRLIPRIGKAYACSRWPLDWSFCLVTRVQVDRGLAASYGQKHLGFSLYYPGSPFGEIVIAYSRVTEVYDDLTSFLASDLLGGALSSRELSGSVAPSVTSVEHEVTNTSREAVFHGNSTRS
jgi:hypothetical protein